MNLKKSIAALLCSLLCSIAFAAPPKDIYEIRIYQLSSAAQVSLADQYLKNIYIPALRKAGIVAVGVFKPLSNDTALVKKIYLLIPYTSLSEWKRVKNVLDKDSVFLQAFADSSVKNLPYARVESILLEAFRDQVHFEKPALNSASAEWVYELRSYESPTEKLHQKKITMFNEGGEIPLFKKLGFNAVFYADVLSGSHMPNLMYMVVYDNLESKDRHWKSFGDAPEWKALTANPYYENNISVSHIESVLMRRTEYSDF